MTASDTPRRWPLALLLLGLVLIAWGSIVLQFYFVRPFAPQTPRGLRIAAFLRDAAPILASACLVVAVGAGIVLMRRTRPLGRAVVVVALLATLGATIAARVNVFERMFAPLRSPRFVAAGAVDFLEPSDAVLAVSAGGEDVAYPVRLLAYHHLVHDQVGGRALVATY